MTTIHRQGNELKIWVTHVNIRLSISYLVFKLIIVDFVASLLVILFHVFVISPVIRDIADVTFGLYAIILFLAVVFLKLFITIYLILKWLSEYYEITPKFIYHRRGVIFQKEERYAFNHIQSIAVEQGIFGKLFNYGHLRMFDWYLNRYVILYRIHNPMKYIRILEGLIPNIDEERKTIRSRLIEEEKEM